LYFILYVEPLTILYQSSKIKSIILSKIYTNMSKNDNSITAFIIFIKDL